MNIDKQIELAEGIITAGNYKKAITILVELCNNDPLNDHVRALLGYTKFAIHEIEESLNDLNKAIEINPNNDLAHWYLSQIFSEKFEFNKARKHIEKAHEINSTNWYYVSDFAFIEQQLTNHKNSIELNNKILKEFPNEPFARASRGYSYLEMQEYELAIQDFHIALENNPNDHMTLNNLGFALVEYGNFKDSIKYFKLAIKIEPNFAYPYDNMGYAYHLDGNHSFALQLINKSIEMDPSNSWAYKNRAIVKYDLGQLDDAIDDLEVAGALGYTEDYDNKVNELLKQYKTEANTS